MKRLDALRVIYPELEESIVVTIMGAVAAELYSLGHRPNFFYLEHAMGLASSMGLGLALSKPTKRVVVLDGDGSLLMNLGTLGTLAWYAPSNMVHVVFDNQSLLSVGGFPTATSARADLAGIARCSGFEHAVTVNNEEDLRTEWHTVWDRNKLGMIVARVDAIGPASFRMDLSLLENRFQFQRWLQQQES